MLFHSYWSSFLPNIIKAEINAIRNLGKTKDIIIIHPDKGDGVGILNGSDYTLRLDHLEHYWGPSLEVKNLPQPSSFLRLSSLCFISASGSLPLFPPIACDVLGAVFVLCCPGYGGGASGGSLKIY